MNEIKISVIVPVYNTSKFLEKCIRSIIEQDFRDIEIICVNDGSKDNSLEILEKLQKEDNRIIIINKENSGSSSARNTALKIAKGKYCLNIDSDDYIEQGYFKALYERAEKDDLDITLSNIIFDYFGKSEKNYILNDLKISDKEVITGNEYIDIFLKENFHGYTCNKLIKTELYKKNNITYNEKIFLFEDVEVILRLSKYTSKIGKINNAFYHYIQHQLNGSKNISIKSLNDILKCFNSLIESFKFDNELILKLQNRKYIILFSLLEKSLKIRENIEYKKIQKEFLEGNARAPFLNRDYKIGKTTIIYCNILKIFSSVNIMNLLFMLDSIVIEKLRKLKNR